MFQDFNYLRKYTLLNAINHFGPISRTSLVEISGYRPATVGAYINEFIENKLVIESGSISNGHGRNRVMLEINRLHLCAICISFSPRHITLVVVQTNGEIIAQKKVSFSPESPSRATLREVTDTVSSFLRDFEDKKFIGIGLCKFLFEYDHDRTALDEWIVSELIPELDSLTDIPAYSFSDVSLPSIAEKNFGVARDKQNFIWINMANDIRASLFCGGHDVRGADNAAGALGHMVVDFHAHDTLCTCGSRGCVERVAAWPAVERSIAEAMRSGVSTKLTASGITPEDLSIINVRRALDEGDRLCAYYVKKAAREIGLAVANAVNLLNPEMVVTHGFMLQLGRTFKDELEATIRENVLPENEAVEICISNDFENPMLLGAAAEIFSTFLCADNYQWLYTLSVTDHE